MIWSIVVGFFIGVVAKFLMPGKDPGGFIITILLGVAGSMIAGWLGLQAGLYTESEPAGLIASILGAMLLLFLYRMFTQKRAI